jgi:hypothetical protein
VIPTCYRIQDFLTHTIIALHVGWMMDKEGIGHNHGHMVSPHLYCLKMCCVVEKDNVTYLSSCLFLHPLPSRWPSENVEHHDPHPAWREWIVYHLQNKGEKRGINLICNVKQMTEICEIIEHVYRITAREWLEVLPPTPLSPPSSLVSPSEEEKVMSLDSWCNTSIVKWWVVIQDHVKWFFIMEEYTQTNHKLSTLNLKYYKFDSNFDTTEFCNRK